jgi:hypothetical protein
MSNNWISTKFQLPPQNVVVETKVSDAKGERNMQKLKLHGALWWDSDDRMYVYYMPTHWRFI